MFENKDKNLENKDKIERFFLIFDRIKINLMIIFIIINYKLYYIIIFNFYKIFILYRLLIIFNFFFTKLYLLLLYKIIFIKIILNLHKIYKNC